MASMRVRYFSWSRRVRVRSSRKVRRAAKGLSTARGRRRRWAFWWSLRRSSRWRRAARPATVWQALAGVDGAGLFAFLVDGEDEATVLEFVVDLEGSGGEEDHHGAFDLVLVSDELAGGRILPGGGDGELALGLEELERIGGALGAFLLDDGEDFVGEVGLAHVEEGLAGHSGELLAVLRGDEVEDSVHEGGLAGGGGGLDDDGQGVLELSGDGADVAGELVGVLADAAAGGVVCEDAIDEVGIAQEGEGLFALGVGHGGRGWGGFCGALEGVVLEFLELEEDEAEVGVDEGLGAVEFECGGLDEGGALPGLEEVEGVDVEAGTGIGADQEVDAQGIEGGVLGEATGAVAAIADLEAGLVGVDGDAEFGGSWRRRKRRSCRRLAGEVRSHRSYRVL
ncbi:MAG: hypothetical protein FD126_2290 [Elusimicrobia bacterium]|nr:MAG: hypothetical protein FD126_2290 [Elusimicrobiota bacterium]